MSTTDLSQVQDQVQKFWSPIFVPELKEATLLPSLVNKDYEGEIKKEGDTVRVSQLIKPEAQLRTVGVDADTFESSLLQTAYIDVKADKRIVAAVEITELAELQSQLGSQNSAIRQALMDAVAEKLNDYLYSMVAPSVSAPDHVLNSITDMNASQLSSIRMLAAQAKWDKLKGWFALLDPSYYNDLLNAQTLTSTDYTGGEAPLIAGQIANKRFGFNILEDNSRATDKGLFFHPDFLHLVMQMQPRFKVSDLHSQKKFGYLLSCDLIVGAKIGIDGAKKHIVATAAASGYDM